MILESMRILEKEAELEEIVRLVGSEALSQEDQLLLETARSIREDFLHQNAFHEVDTFASIKKQYLMLKAILRLYDICKDIISKEEVTVKELRKSPVWEKIARMKYFGEQELGEIERLIKELDNEIRQPIN